MSKLLVSAVVAAGLMLGGASSFAGEAKEKTGSSVKHSATGESQMMGKTGMTDEMRMSGMVGQVTAVNGDTIEVRSKDGITRSLKITAKSQEQNKGKLQGLSAETIKVGDTVYIQSTEQGRDVSIHKISESGSGTWMMDETGGIKENGSGKTMKGEPNSGSEPAPSDFESESRSPGEGGQEDPTK